MEVNQTKEGKNWRLCQTHNCLANASATCLTDGVVACNMCTAVFHYDCNVNIKYGEGFIYHTLETLKDLVKTIKDKGMKTRIDRIIIDFREEIIHIQDNIKELEDEIAKNQICSSNVDYFVQKTRKLAKSIIESNIYSVYTGYIVKLKICGIVANKHDECGEIGLHNIRTQFYLDAKRKEMDFCENKLKALAQEINARVTQAKLQSDQKFTAVESRLSHETSSAKSDTEELKKLMFSMFEEIKKDQKSKFDEISLRIDEQKKKAQMSEKLYEQHKEEFKSNLEVNKQKIGNLEKKQEEIKKEIDLSNKNTEERESKQDKKINELNNETSNSIKKIDASIEDISQKIKSSNESLESKIGATESSLKEDLNKKQEDCSKLVEQYSEEFKINYSELKQTVDTIQENLIPVTQILDKEIQEIKRVAEEKRKKEIEDKEKYEKMLEELSLKDDQFYIDKFKLVSNEARKFKKDFASRSDRYKELGQFSYDQPHCTKYHITTCFGKSRSGYNCIYIGEVKEGTDDIPHGIGIQVDCDGNIYEGYWKDGKLHGRGRYIEFLGNYYIGEWKEGSRDGEGSYYFSNYKYEGEWKNNRKHGQGTYYTNNGDKYTGQWDDNKGQGEINYKDGTKYTGQWDGCNQYDIKRNGLGTLYSADGQVLNQGKWEYDEYKGKE